MPDSEIINPGLPVAGPYCPGIKVGNLLFISGQGYPQEGSDIKEQTRKTLDKIKQIVEKAGGKVSNVVATTVFMQDMTQFAEMNKTYQKFFEDNGVTSIYPARATVESSKLPLATMLIEISAIAVL